MVFEPSAHCLLCQRTPGEGPILSWEQGRAWVPVETTLQSAEPPTQGLRVFPAFGPVVYLFSPPYNRVSHGYSGRSWENYLSLQDVRTVQAQTHRTECWSDLGELLEAIEGRCLYITTTDIWGQILRIVGGGGGACRVRGKGLSSFSGLCPIDTSSTSPVMIAKNVSRYCLIKTSSVEYHWSGAIPVPHLADRKLSPAEGDKPSQSYSYSASAGVETRTQDPHGSHTQGQRAALLSFADCSVGFCFYFCFSSSSMSDPSISCFHFIVPFLSFCFSYCITEINPSLGNREVQKEGDKEHSAAPR